MIVQTASISEEGLSVEFSDQDAWGKEIVLHTQRESMKLASPIVGSFKIYKQFNHLKFTGHIRFKQQLTCDRCLNPYESQIDLEINRLLTPLFESERQREIEKKLNVEVTRDDLDFSFYEGNEINVSAIFSEQIILEQPMFFYCRPDCKGLCPHCGHNLNQGLCRCNTLSQKESPFSILKQWKH